MLQTVNIQNFKSLKDVTVTLQKVNVLIGPNNSGKSNFLKALAFLKEYYNQRLDPNINDLKRIYFKQNVNERNSTPITFCLYWHDSNLPVEYIIYKLELFGYTSVHPKELIYSELIGAAKNDLDLKISLEDIATLDSILHDFYIEYENHYPSIIKEEYKRLERFKEPKFMYRNKGPLEIKLRNGPRGGLLQHAFTKDDYLPFNLYDVLNEVKIYKPDPSKIAKESMLLFDMHVSDDCSNLVAFLDNMRDEFPNVWKAIENDLNRCLPEFEGINFGKVTINDALGMSNKKESIGKRFGLRDKFGKTYWADELSEGTIYFLALLAIIHQPNPPKLLLLEEPEKGIHPRRIKEVMDLIFRLAEEKDIQVILTTHSTQVVDEFQDIPESVFVFDNQNGETKIKNLLTDIIEPDDKNAEQKGYPKLDFSKHTLGEHWAIGFLGGVPK